MRSDVILEHLDSLHEHKIAKYIFVPVLKAMGLKGVKYTGGTDEQGIDIEYYELTEPEKTKKYVGVQFKKGDLVYSGKGSKNSIKEIKNQAEEAFEKEIHDLNDNSVHYISRFIVATTGEINEKARVIIGRARQKGMDRQIHYWDGERLVEYIQQYWLDQFIEYFKIDSEEIEENIDEINIVDEDYIEENYAKDIEEIKKVRNIVNGIEWEVIATIGLLQFRNQGRIPVVDLLMELGNTEDYYRDEFRHLVELDLIEFDEDNVVGLSRYAHNIVTLYDDIAQELEDAEEDVDDAENIFDRIIN